MAGCYLGLLTVTVVAAETALLGGAGRKTIFSFFCMYFFFCSLLGPWLGVSGTLIGPELMYRQPSRGQIGELSRAPGQGSALTSQGKTKKKDSELDGVGEGQRLDWRMN